MIKINIRKLLDKQEKSVYWLADKTGIHYNNLRRIVNNETRSIKYENIELLCTWLECTPNDLFNITKSIS